MNKEDADKLILQYRERIYGFSLGKLLNIAQADELASEIICQVYIAFLNTETIANTDGYVYRIASNVYSRYIQYLSDRRRTENIDGMDIPFYDSYSHDTDREDLLALRKEISYLSQRQRTILYLHYYEKLTAAKIAEKLGISSGTVKWHLSDARSNLKEGLIMTERKTNLTVNPVKFIGMGFHGDPGNTKGTAGMFDSRLKQNIAWLCYWEPRTLEEISRNLSVPTAYVADELEKLVAFGYIDQLDNSKNPKYRTNMMITDIRIAPAALPYTSQSLYKEAAKKLIDTYFAPLFKLFEEDSNHFGLRHVTNDLNFMKYSLLILGVKALSYKDTSEEYSRLMVKRPDGGNFIAYATISDDCQQKDYPNWPYWASGWMMRGADHWYSLQLDCAYTDRPGDWQDNRLEDWEYLAQFIKTGCDPEKLPLEAYKRLCDKGYIQEGRVQVVTAPALTRDFASYLSPYTASLKGNLDSITDYHREIDEKMFRLEEGRFPKHMEPLVRLSNTNMLASNNFVPYLLEELLAQGLLNPLDQVQKKAALSILFYS